ncbi:MAG TPA: nucleotidyltransferase [Sulfolobales archaeon]|nr:nucleotidyltransferase [Sulfolobales archaeon]
MGVSTAYRLEDLVSLFKQLEGLGLRFVIIGNTSIYYAMGRRVFEDDVDLYIYEGSLASVESSLRSIADEMGWDVGSTELGTPSLIIRNMGEEIAVDLYEALYDFYVPSEIIEASRIISLDGISVRILAPEQHIVLKARAGSEESVEDLARYADLVENGELKVNIQEIKRLAQLFEDMKTIIQRLRKAGFQL